MIDPRLQPFFDAGADHGKEMVDELRDVIDPMVKGEEGEALLSYIAGWYSLVSGTITGWIGSAHMKQLLDNTMRAAQKAGETKRRKLH